LSPGYVAGTVGGDLLAADKGDEIRQRLPLGRFSMVDEMAQMAMLMVSPLTSYMTGQIVALDGGVSLLGGSAMLDLAGA
jgi:NAD(P)-dependent dehydrogenase (short-subunit alcohol dehydrogenase family)